MDAQNIINLIQSGITAHGLITLQRGDLTTLVPDYANLLLEFKALDTTQQDALIADVRKQRPLIGKRLKEQFLLDIAAENTPGDEGK